MKRILLTLTTFLGAWTAQSQIHELGVTVGATNYIGDIGSTQYINPTDLGYGFQYRWNKSARHSWRVNYTYMPITGKDLDSDMPFRQARGLETKNKLNELMVGLEFNFFEFDLHNDWFAFTPYVHTGIAGLSYKESYFNQYNRQIEKDTEYSLAVPVTLGVKALINKKLVISAEIGARYAFTDNLDGNNPANPSTTIQSFGNVNSKDWYVFSGINISYTFGKNPCYCAPR
ncbi:MULTISPECIES: DUF6089 family protein [unclassified Flavobacterium]|uniref:type IX secretion system protein PorG n=1 Tax=unclassified Flavobacterium TaxID=196869 RepID=UPI0013D72AE4|nr:MULTISPECIES: DUF6089 family protein [unclassified Flavobacterium]MBA5792367.1 outer membrane beta-barrel protein [Flavobacterium sp. xlx-221]